MAVPCGGEINSWASDDNDQSITNNYLGGLRLPCLGGLCSDWLIVVDLVDFVPLGGEINEGVVSDGQVRKIWLIIMIYQKIGRRSDGSNLLQSDLI